MIWSQLMRAITAYTRIAHILLTLRGMHCVNWTVQIIEYTHQGKVIGARFSNFEINYCIIGN